MLRVLEMLCEAGSPDKPNEDFIFCSDNCIAVLDGATDLNGSDYGANEFVRDFTERFERLIKHMPPPQAVTAAVGELYRFKFGDMPVPNDIALYSSAVAAFAVETETSLQVLTLGDCVALVYTDDGIKKVKNNSLDRLDRAVIKRLKSLHESTGADVIDLMKTAEIKDMLIANRLKMNTANGYKSISFNLKQLTERNVRVFDKTRVQQVVLYSDGFKSMGRQIRQGMPARELYAKLRQEENNDKKLNKTPRFKISDDASIVRFTIES